MLRGEGLGFLNDHNGDAITNCIRKLAGMAEQGVFIFTRLYLSFALGTGEDIKEFFFHIFSRIVLFIGRAGSAGSPDAGVAEAA